MELAALTYERAAASGTLKAPSPDRATADAEFALGIPIQAGEGPDAIPHFKEAQRLAPDNWNYKRQAWALSDAEKTTAQRS